MLTGYLKMRRMQEATELLEEMKVQGVTPSRATYLSLDMAYRSEY
jgi:pentatricopeptide repeat protein